MFFKLCVYLLLINFGLLDAVAHKTASIIPRGPLVEDNVIRLQVIIPEGADKFKIRLQKGGDDDDKTDIILSIVINLTEEEIGICAKKDGKELQPEKFKNVVQHDEPYSIAEILILVKKDVFHININGYIAVFPITKKIPMKNIDHVVYLGDAELELLVIKSVSKKDLQKLEKI